MTTTFNYDLLIRNQLIEFQQLAQEDLSYWRLKKQKKGMDVYVRRENSHRTPITKMITTIEAPIDRIIECLDTLEIRRQWQPELMELQVIEEINEEARVLYEALKLPAVFSNRDICYLEVFQRNGSEAIYVYKSLNHPNCPRNRGFVRLNGIISGFQLREEGNITHFLGIDQLDLEGSIPGFLRKLFAVEVPFVFGQLKDYIANN